MIGLRAIGNVGAQAAKGNRKCIVANKKITNSYKSIVPKFGTFGLSSMYEGCRSLYKRISGIDEVTYVLGNGRTVNLQQSQTDTLLLDSAEADLRAYVHVAYADFTNDGQAAVEIGLDRSVWLSGIELSLTDPDLKDKVMALKRLDNTVMKANILRILENADEDIKEKLPERSAGRIAYDDLVRRLNQPGVGELEAVEAFKTLLSSTTLLNDRGVPMFVDDKGVPMFTELQDIRQLFCDQNAVPVENRSYEVLANDAIKHAKDKLSGFLGLKTFARRTGRKWDRLAANVCHWVGYKTVRRPTNIVVKFAEMDANSADLIRTPAVVKDFNHVGDASGSIRGANPGLETRYCEEYRLNSTFVLEAMKHCYVDLDKVFTHETGKPKSTAAEKKAALEKAYNLLESLWEAQEADPFRPKVQNLEEFLIDRLAYAVPNVVDHTLVFGEFARSKNVNLKGGKLEQAQFIQRQIAQRHRSAEDDRTFAQRWVPGFRISQRVLP